MDTKTLWIIYIFLVNFNIALECSNEDDCECYPGSTLEIQCPRNHTVEDERLIIHVNKGKLKIDCKEMEIFRSELLPNLLEHLGNIEMLEINHCPLSPNNFKTILTQFGIAKVNIVAFDNVTFSKDYFDELPELKRLWINELNFSSIDKDFFSNTPRLYDLEMRGNKGRGNLTANIFNKLTGLNKLDLSKNGLKDIPDGIFEKLSSLRKLWLDDNELSTLTEFTFFGLSNLTTLNLRHNNITNISEKAFAHLTQLKQIDLSGNDLDTIPPNLFENNKNITRINMQHLPYLQLPDNFFANMITVQEVYLENCNLSSIHELTFENSTNLNIVSLAQNKLKYLPPLLFRGLINLNELYLEDNLISKIEKNTFEDLKSLEKIHLERNAILSLHPNIFYNNINLEIIDLSHNQYSGGFNLLEGPRALKKLYLSHNMIKHIKDAVYPESLGVDFVELDLRYNFITEVELTDLTSSKELTVRLNNNNITKIIFDDLNLVKINGKSKIFLNNNPINCDCDSYRLYQFLQQGNNNNFDIASEDIICDTPLELKDQKLINVHPSKLICDVAKEDAESGCPSKCSCFWRPFDRSMVIDCSNQNLTEFPTINLTTTNLFNQTEMHLEKNNFDVGPSENLIGYDNITKLNIAFNRIKNISWLPPKLEVLHLESNELKSLDYGVLGLLNSSNLASLTLHNNPWSCNCLSLNFTNFLRERQAKIVDAKNISCFNSSTKLINLSEADLCNNRLIFYIIFPIFMISIILASSFALFYRYQEEIKVWLFDHELCLWWVLKEEFHKDRLYDAFISYSNKDEDFIVENLLPILEGGPNPYKLFLPERNSTPGELIGADITKGILESRRTLVVVSSNFLEDLWKKMEFRTAHVHAMTEGRTKVIIVLYGDIEVDKLDDELKSYLKTNTYIKWGHKHFLRNLKYAMPHAKKTLNKNNQKIVNLLNYIDHKFKLRVNVQSERGDKPVSIDVDVLKKHALEPEINILPKNSNPLILPSCG